MKQRIFFIVVACMLAFFGDVVAQQELHYTHYMYNTSVINPAYVGNRNTFSLIAMHRSQWVGVEGAPTSQVITINSALGEQLGIGGALFRDAIGPVIELSATTDISYALPLNSRGRNFAFGIKAGIQSLTVDYNKLSIYDPNDVLFQNRIEGRGSPVIGVGFYTYDDNWYVGLSTPNFLKTTHYNGTNVSNYSKKMHVYAMAGYVFEINEEIDFKPAGLVRMTHGAPISIDISGNVIFQKKYTIGLSYREGVSASLLAGIQLSEKVLLGYSYDYSLTTLSNFSLGSHELILKYELPVSQRRPLYLRCF